jgi:hypothetical protein
MKDDWNQSTIIKTEMEFTGYSNDMQLSQTDKTDRHHITEIFLKVVLNTITLILSMLSNPIDLLQNYIKVVL